MISCFSFLFKGVPRENILKEGEGGFLFVKLGESTEREGSFESLFSPWKRKVGVPWASVVLLFPYVCIFICSSDGFGE